MSTRSCTSASPLAKNPSRKSIEIPARRYPWNKILAFSIISAFSRSNTDDLTVLRQFYSPDFLTLWEKAAQLANDWLHVRFVYKDLVYGLCNIFCKIISSLFAIGALDCWPCHPMRYAANEMPQRTTSLCRFYLGTSHSNLKSIISLALSKSWLL